MDKNLLKKLEQKRQMMIESGMVNGLQNPKTIRLSKQLDQLMNQFEGQTNKKKMNNQITYYNRSYISESLFKQR